MSKKKNLDAELFPTPGSLQVERLRGHQGQLRLREILDAGGKVDRLLRGDTNSEWVAEFRLPASDTAAPDSESEPSPSS